MPHTTTYYDSYSGDMRHLSYASLQYRSLKEDMKRLSRAEVFSHPIGRAMVGIWTPSRSYEHRKVLAYAGVTGFEDFQGKHIATIGGVLVLPSARCGGIGFDTVEAVVLEAQAEEKVAEYGHAGLLARCNQASRGIFSRLGFEEAVVQGNKSIMMKML